MEIIIQIRNHIYSICFGRKTQWFEQIWWFSLTEEWLHHREVVYAKILMALWRE